jgi:PIN domain nuclease of toxin-antitoxin system
LRDAVHRRKPIAISAITLLKVAVLFGQRRSRNEVALDELLDDFESDPAFQSIPFTVKVAKEVAAIGEGLRDPADRAIVAPARIGKLKLLTSDQRIIDSGLTPVIA